MQRMPPLNALQAFLVVARHRSFTRAAEHLCLTQGAVSRQILALEEHYGFQLEAAGNPVRQGAVDRAQLLPGVSRQRGGPAENLAVQGLDDAAAGSLMNGRKTSSGPASMTIKKRNLRLFYALWPDDATRSALIKLQAPIRGRMTPAEDLHLTLAFLGTQPAAALPALQALMARLPAPAFTLNLDCLGHFPRSGIAWAGMQQMPAALAALRQALLAALAEQNIAIDQGAHFKPHITLARDAITMATAPEMSPIIWRADHIALVQSATTGSGPRYRLLASRRLDAG